MTQKQATEERAPVPKRPKKRKDLFKYFEQHKEAILADYESMRLIDFFARWGFTTNTWTRLKKQWAVAGKRGPKATKPTEAEVDGVALSEHDRYLILLGYQQAVREVLANSQTLAATLGAFKALQK